MKTQQLFDRGGKYIYFDKIELDEPADNIDNPRAGPFRLDRIISGMQQG
jgi:hypothetical protein